MVNPSPVSVARAERAVAVLRECTTFEGARPRLLAECGEGAGSSLRAVFARAGFDAPSAYLRGATKARGARIEEPPVYSSRPPRPVSDTDPAPPPAAAANDEDADIAPNGVYTGAAPPDPDRTYVDRSPICAVAEPVVPFREERIGFFPDAHLPYVDREKFALALRVFRFFQPRRIVVLGDWLDGFAVSFHSKSPARYRRLVDEIHDSSWALDEVDALGAESKHFIEGNHEARLARMIEGQAPALHGLKGTTIEEILDLQSRGWTHSKYMVEHHIGRLRCCHDYGQAGKYSLGRAMVTMDSDLVQGHTHLAQTVHGVSRAGGIISADSFGWLGSFDEITYTHRGIAMQQWAHGCGVGWTQPDGRVRREVVRLASGKPTIEGQAC